MIKNSKKAKITLAITATSSLALAATAVGISQVTQVNSVTPLKTFSSTGASTTKYFFRPSSIQLDATAENWTLNKYASQITSADIQKLFTFTRTDEGKDGSATESASGFKFQKLETTGAQTITTSALNSNFGFSLGEISQSSISPLIINVAKIDNLAGEVYFRVYQPVSGYTKNSDGSIDLIKPDATDTAAVNPYEKGRALITPPTKYAATEDDTMWKLPSLFAIKKVEYDFAWSPEVQITNFIQNSQKAASDVTETDIKQNFYNISLKYNSSDSPSVTLPQPTTIKLTPITNVGRLDVEITLPSGFGGAEPKVMKKTFFGFPKNKTDANETILNLVTNTQLLNSDIKMPYWDETNDGGKTLIGKKVSTLLPSQFVKTQTRFNTPFVEVFSGKKKRITYGSNITAEQAALNIGTEDNAIGWLTYLDYKSGASELGSLPPFNIKEITAYPNDQEGTLSFVIKYETFANDSSIIEAPLASVHYTGFAKNLDSGKPLSFAWKNILPSKYASLTATQIVTNFRQLTSEKEQEDPNSFSDTVAAKQFVANFFDASSFLMQKYNKPYFGISNNATADPALFDRARVKVSSVTSTAEGGSDKRQRVLVAIEFANFNGKQNFVLNQIFETSQEESNLPTALQSSIKVNPEFLKSGHRFSEKYPSTLNVEQIKQLIVLEIPDKGEEYTSRLEDAIIFAIPDDKTGKLVVSIIFPKFNNIVNYEFSYVFYNFKINPNLALNLELTHTPLLNLPQAFLAKNPLDQEALTANDVLKYVFGSIDPNILKLIGNKNIEIIERTKTSIKIKMVLNWPDLLDNVDATTGPVTVSGTTPPASDVVPNDLRFITFTITGFTGGENFIKTNDTPLVPEAVISFWAISLIGLAITIPLVLIIILFGLRMLAQRKKYKDKIIDLENKTGGK